MSIVASNFLGSITEVCIVTADHKKTMDGLLKLGIGPFQVFDFTSDILSNRNFRGKAGAFELNACSAKQGDLTFAIMQPITGESLMQEYLDQRNGKEGFQHIAFDCENIPMEERNRQMRDRGFELAMQGIWRGTRGTCHFRSFDTEAGSGTVFETIEFSEDFEDLDCEWYPQGTFAEALRSSCVQEKTGKCTDRCKTVVSSRSTSIDLK